MRVLFSIWFLLSLSRAIAKENHYWPDTTNLISDWTHLTRFQCSFHPDHEDSSRYAALIHIWGFVNYDSGWAVVEYHDGFGISDTGSVISWIFISCELRSRSWPQELEIPNLRLFIDLWLRRVQFSNRQLPKNKTQELERPILDHSSISDYGVFNFPTDSS